MGARRFGTQRNAAELNNCTAKRKRLDVCQSVVKASSGLPVALTRRTTSLRAPADVSKYSRVAISCRTLPCGSDISPVFNVPRHARRGAVTEHQRPCALGTAAYMWMAYGCRYGVVQTGPGAQPASCTYNGYRVFTGVKWPECGADHLHSSRAEVKHEYY